jgi:hypothetical protein
MARLPIALNIFRSREFLGLKWGHQLESGSISDQGFVMEVGDKDILFFPRNDRSSTEFRSGGWLADVARATDKNGICVLPWSQGRCLVPVGQSCGRGISPICGALLRKQARYNQQTGRILTSLFELLGFISGHFDAAVEHGCGTHSRAGSILVLKRLIICRKRSPTSGPLLVNSGIRRQYSRFVHSLYTVQRVKSRSLKCYTFSGL